MRLVLIFAAAMLLAPNCAVADKWDIYIPPSPYSPNPLPFSASTWVFVRTVDDRDSTLQENGEACDTAAMIAHYRYSDAGDKDASQRAFSAVCVSRTTGMVRPSIHQAELQVDVPPGRQERWSGTSVHVCPPGFAMAGAHVVANRFTCVRIVGSGHESEVRSALDTGSLQDYGTGPMRICPFGTYMRGLHDINHWLICANAAGVALGTPFLDAHGTTQRNGMHTCPIVVTQSVMVGIDSRRNDFLCATIPGR